MNAPRLGVEISIGALAIVGSAMAVGFGVLATDATGMDGPLQVLVSEYGPIGVAVAMLWHKMNRLEDRVRENSREIDKNT